MADITWELNLEAEPLGCSDGFYYGLTNGYVDIESVLTSAEQTEAVWAAIELLKDFQATLETEGLWEDF